jgi:hypothetical protein
MEHHNEVLLYYYYCFGSTGVWTQDFALTRQVVYHLSHISSPLKLKKKNLIDIQQKVPLQPLCLQKTSWNVRSGRVEWMWGNYNSLTFQRLLPFLSFSFPP